MKRLVIFLFLTSVCLGDTYTSHQNPITDSTLDIGGVTLFWRYIYGDAFTDGTALWSGNDLSGFGSISGNILTDGIFRVTGGVITDGIWNGTDIDISGYTNLVAGNNITLVDDTLDVDDAFLINNGDDTTTGTLTMNGLIVVSDPPADATSPGVAGTITWDSDYIYVCVAANTWERTAIATWVIPAENVIYAAENVIYAAEQVVYP